MYVERGNFYHKSSERLIKILLVGFYICDQSNKLMYNFELQDHAVHHWSAYDPSDTVLRGGWSRPCWLTSRYRQP